MSRRGRRTTAEERALWDQVARDIRRHAETAPPPQAAPVHVEVAPQAPDPARPPQGPVLSLRPAGRSEPAVIVPAPRPAPPSGLDRATETRLRKGRRTPDARLDLHGMTALAAHRALAAFLFESRAAGRRCVLVITGKGGFGDERPGILRREAPFWLETPPLSEIVVNVTPAHPRHGGGGALYVYLRKAR